MTAREFWSEAGSSDHLKSLKFSPAVELQFSHKTRVRKVCSKKRLKDLDLDLNWSFIHFSRSYVDRFFMLPDGSIATA